jgi:plasmid stability protein
VANVTLAIDEEILRRARIRALEQGTSVNALIRQYLESFAGNAAANEGVAAFLELASRSSATSGKVGRAWTRDDLYAR